jgi:O-antigen biosynthesis protein
MIRAAGGRRHAMQAPELNGCVVPILIAEVELSDAVPMLQPDVDGRTYPRARVLVRLHGTPIGTVDVDLAGGPVPPADLAVLMEDRLGGRIRVHLVSDGLPVPEALTETGLGAAADPPCLAGLQEQDEPISVVIATHGRPHRIGDCIASVVATDYPAGSLEVFVVDNAPTGPETKELVAERFGHLGFVHYLVEPRQSRALARNHGLAQATTRRVAFLDDDVVVDRLWLRALVRAFNAEPTAGAVTSMILPAELETAPQVWIEEFGGFDKGYDPRVYDLDRHVPPDALYPYTPGKFGSGAAMAFDRELLGSLGGFDPALLRGQDVDAIMAAVLSGRALVYDPRSFVRHYHHREYADLERVVRGYGLGLSAVMTKAMLQPRHTLGVLKRLPRGVVYLLAPTSAKNQKKSSSFPRELTTTELRGVLAGPFTYLFRWRRGR